MLPYHTPTFEDLMAVPTEGSDAALQAASRYSMLLYAVAGRARASPAARSASSHSLRTRSSAQTAAAAAAAAAAVRTVDCRSSATSWRYAAP